MTFRLINDGWDKEIRRALRVDGGILRIICPFIKASALQRLLDMQRPSIIQVITRFNLADFAQGVSDIAALRMLVERGAEVRGVCNLHAKLYLCGGKRAVITSANLTDAALLRNHEFGCISEETTILESCNAYFDNLWVRSGPNLTLARLKKWDRQVVQYLASGARQDRLNGLADEGIDVGVVAEPPGSSPQVDTNSRAFVKFLGIARNRVPLSFDTITQIESAGCHWAVAYPSSKRPTGILDGDVMFISRLTRDPNDIRVFGRAISLKYVPGRDDATPADIARRPWKEKWPRYIRVHHAEFIGGTMSNGISLNQLMESLGANAFASTQRNAEKGSGNTDPRRAYSQQAAVQLSRKGFEWLNWHIDEAFSMYGKVPFQALAKLDWPDLPK